jgi:hypothetical protein
VQGTSKKKKTAMTRNIIIVAGLAMLIGVAVGSLSSAKIASAQLGDRVAMNEPADATQTDAKGGVIARDRWGAYWNRVANAKDLDVLRPMRQCATY